MEILDTEIAEVKLIRPARHGDARGFFSETFNARAMREAGLPLDLVQHNHVLSGQVYTLRGIHYQVGEHRQNKLVRIASGRALDVAVDLRKGSPTFARHVRAELSAENWLQMLVPEGFGHAILTLEPDTVINYCTTAYYSPENEHGVRCDDPDLAIDWGVATDRLILSDRDRALPLLKDQSLLP